MTARRAPYFAIGIVLATVALAGCNDIQSALSPRGPEASRVAILSLVLFIGGTVILIAVVLLAAAAIYGNARSRAWLSREAVIVAGGIVFPVVTLTILLGYGLLATRAGGAVASDGSEPLRISVVGEQYWWRVIYADQNGSRFESANELRIPAGRRVELSLLSTNVIHSFWVPNLAGKVDMIPGRVNTLTIEADRPGLSRGQCAEYCGGAHALMSFYVVAMEPAEFDTWLAHEAGPAEPPVSATEEQGELLFVSSGCGACHAIRGAEARGAIGPDLTHVGSRHSIAAGTLANSPESIADWIANNQHIKPENRMPPFSIFSEAELRSLSSYLASLR